MENTENRKSDGMEGQLEPRDVLCNIKRTKKNNVHIHLSRVAFHVLDVGLGFHVVIGVGRLIDQFHHAYVIPSFSSSWWSPTLSCHRQLRLWPWFLHGNRLDCLHTNQHSETQSKKRIWADCDSTRPSLCPWIRWVFITMKCKEKKKRSAVEELGKVKDQTMTIANDTWCARMTNICFEKTRLASLWLCDSIVSHTQEHDARAKPVIEKYYDNSKTHLSDYLADDTFTWKVTTSKLKLTARSSHQQTTRNIVISFQQLDRTFLFCHCRWLDLCIDGTIAHGVVGLADGVERWELKCYPTASCFISRNVANVSGKSARDETRAVVLRWLFKFLTHTFSYRNLPYRVAMYVFWY